MRCCIEAFHTRHLYVLKGRWAKDNGLLASAPKKKAIQDSVRQIVAEAWDIYK